MPPAVFATVATATARAACPGRRWRYASSAPSEGNGSRVAARKQAAARPRSSVMLNSPPPGGDGEERLSGAGAQGARLRRGDRVAARARDRAVEAPGQPPVHQARGLAGGILVQAARGLQQDGRAAAGASA